MTLTLAIPSKGRLREQALELLAAAGLPVSLPGDDRKYRARVEDRDDIEVAFLSASEIAGELGQGNFDLGITGEDLVRESRADWDARVYDAATLGLSVVGADAKLLKVLERACRQLLGPEPRKQDLVRDARELVIDRLAKGPLRIDDIARELSMSSKTLERRLGGRGVTFSALLDEVRCELAKRYLGETDFRLEQVAYLVGYSEPAPLVRAFKRWTGTTPMQYRNRRRD